MFFLYIIVHMKKQFQFIAKRGDQGRFVENSQLAVVSSWIDGFMPMVDVRKTKDGTLVLFADPHLMRLTNAPKNVAEMGVEDLHYKDLAKLNLISKTRPSGWQKIPSLESIFQQMHSCKEKQLILNVKAGVSEKLFEEITKRKILEQVLFFAGSERELTKIREFHKSIPTIFPVAGNLDVVEKRVSSLLQNEQIQHFIISVQSLRSADMNKLKEIFTRAENASRRCVLSLEAHQLTLLPTLFNASITNIATDNIPALQKHLYAWLEA